MRDIRTEVGKANPAVKKIIDAILAVAGRTWSGRKVKIVQIAPSWEIRQYMDAGEPYYFYVSHVDRPTAVMYRRPTFSAPVTTIQYPKHGDAVVAQDIGAKGPITIYIPMLDASTLAVARDALLSKDRKLAQATLAQLGTYAGLGAAIAEAQTKTLGKAERGKTSRQLDRDIDAYIRSLG